MADSHVKLTLTVRDLASVKLLVLQLRMLEHKMRVGASPFAEELTRILDRFHERDEAADQPDDGTALP